MAPNPSGPAARDPSGPRRQTASSAPQLGGVNEFKEMAELGAGRASAERQAFGLSFKAERLPDGQVWLIVSGIEGHRHSAIEVAAVSAAADVLIPTLRPSGVGLGTC
jgi:hypothetical protein